MKWTGIIAAVAFAAFVGVQIYFVHHNALQTGKTLGWTEGMEWGFEEGYVEGWADRDLNRPRRDIRVDANHNHYISNRFEVIAIMGITNVFTTNSVHGRNVIISNRFTPFRP